MNNDLNIPIYRAKKIDSDEYVEGYLYESAIYEAFRIITKSISEFSIDSSTLSIHFPNWICIDQETEKEVKVFASLQKDKKGGSIVEVRDNFQGTTGALYFSEASLMFQGIHFTEAELQAFEVTGIQE